MRTLIVEAATQHLMRTIESMMVIGSIQRVSPRGIDANWDIVVNVARMPDGPPLSCMGYMQRALLDDGMTVVDIFRCIPKMQQTEAVDPSEAADLAVTEDTVAMIRKAIQSGGN